MLEYLKNKNIMVVAAHPDDELLGVGGTINLLSNDYNCNCRSIILGEGLTARADERKPTEWEKELEKHKECVSNATQLIGYQSYQTYDLPDNRFDRIDLLDIIKIIEEEKNKFQPEIIFTHHGGDLNIDHQRTYEAVITACRPLKSEIVETIITFETPSSTEWQDRTLKPGFCRNLFIGLKRENIDAKIKGMDCYIFEKKQWPHPRSPEALLNMAQRIGVQVGKDYGEAFHVVRCVTS